MNKIIKINLLVFLFYFFFVRSNSIVHAEEFWICEPTNTIYETVYGCEDNDKFVRAGERCLAKIRKEIDIAKAALHKELAWVGKENQSGNLNDNRESFRLAEKKLSELIDSNQQAIYDIQDYVYFLSFPEDYENQEVTGGDVAGFIEGDACYGESKRSLLSILKDLKKSILELKQTFRVSKDLKISSNDLLLNLDNIGKNKPTAAKRSVHSLGLVTNKSAITVATKQKKGSIGLKKRKNKISTKTNKNTIPKKLK